MLSNYGIGIKDVVLLLAGIACIYLAYMWLRLMQVKRKRQKRASASARALEPKQPPSKIDVMDDSIDDDDEDDQVVYAKPRRQSGDVPARDVEALVSEEPAPAGFARMVNESQQRLVQSQARELEMLREELTILHRRQADMKEEIERLKAASHVSPLYNEAVNMAQHGLNAEGIAARCGISIAEAQLVAALANKSDPDRAADIDEEYHGQTATRHAA